MDIMKLLAYTTLLGATVLVAGYITSKIKEEIEQSARE